MIIHYYGFNGYLQGSPQIGFVGSARDAVPNENINVTQASEATTNFFIVPTSLLILIIRYQLINIPFLILFYKQKRAFSYKPIKYTFSMLLYINNSIF